MNNVVKINKKESIFYAVLKGFVIAIVLSIISIFIYAAILVNTSVQESTIKPVLITVTGICILIGSSISGLRAKKNGMLIGMCVGGIYFFSLYILSSIALCGFYLNISSIIMISVGSVLGAIGGIIGANMAK